MYDDNAMFWEMSDDDGFFGEDEESFISANDPMRSEERYPGELVIATTGAMCQTEGEYEDAQTIYDKDDDVVEYVSMRKHLASKKKGGSKLVLRPFEQWLQDVRTGKKTIDDPL